MLSSVRLLRIDVLNSVFIIYEKLFKNIRCSLVIFFSVIGFFGQAQQTITVSSVSPNKICFSSSSTSVSVTFTKTGSYTSGNVFTAQLSNANGSFTSPITIGTRTATTAGTIAGTIPANTAAGTGYLIRVISSTPAKVSNSVSFAINAPPTANAGTAVTTCSNSGAVNITTGASATNNSSVSWTSSGTGTFANPNSLTTATYAPSAADITAGSVTLTLTAIGNSPCGSATATKTLTITAAPTASAGTAVTTCANSGAVNITAGASATNSSGVTWTSSGTGTFANPNSLTTATYTPSAADITAGSVTLTLTAAGNSPCGNTTSTKNLTITAAPTADAGTAVTTCANSGAVNITAGASATNNSGVTWTSSGTGTFANPNSLTDATYTPSAADIAAGSVTLTLTATGNSPCGNATSTKALTINAVTQADAGDNQTDAATCGLTQVTLAANSPGAGTGMWSFAPSSPNTDGTFGDASSPTSTFSGMAGNTYELRWTITNGTCTSSDDVLVTFNIPPTTADAGPDQTGVCGTTTATLAANTPTVGTGQWSISPLSPNTDGTFGNASSPTSTFTGSSSVYILRWTITNGACESADNVKITFATLPTAFSVTGGGATACVAGIQVGLAGSQTGVNYQLKKDGVNIGQPLAGTGSAISFGNRHVSGTYTVVATSAAGCTNAMTGNAVVTTPDVTITPVNKSNCGSPLDNGSITIDVATGGPYEFSINNGAFQGNGVTFTFTNPPLGDNTIQVRQVSTPSCIASFVVTIKTLNPVAATLYSKTAAGCNGTGGTIKIDARNGPVPYAFSLDGGPGQSSNTFTGVAAGTHSVVVTDARGCTTTVSNIAIAQSTPPTASLFRKTGVACNGNDGSITISATGGTPPYTFSVNGGASQASNTFTGLGVGTYSVTVTDAKNCTATVDNISISQITALTATLFRKTGVSCNGNDGTITISATGGTLPYAFTLNGGTPQTANIFSGLAPGTYSVAVTDARNCTATVSNIEIIQLPAVTAKVISKTNVSCMGGSDGSLTASATGGVSPYQYSLTGPINRSFQSSNVFSNLSAGTYTIVVKDSKACTNTNGPVTAIINDGTGSCIAAGNASSSISSKLNTSSSALKVRALPNPSRTDFTLNLQSNSKERVQIIVTDMFGKKLYQTTGSAEQQYIFGKELRSGTYIVQVIQGREIQTMKLIKEK